MDDRKINGRSIPGEESGFSNTLGQGRWGQTLLSAFILGEAVPKLRTGTPSDINYGVSVSAYEQRRSRQANRDIAACLARRLTIARLHDSVRLELS